MHLRIEYESLDVLPFYPAGGFFVCIVFLFFRCVVVGVFAVSLCKDWMTLYNWGGCIEKQKVGWVQT